MDEDIFFMEFEDIIGKKQILRTERHVSIGVIAQQKRHGCILHSGTNKTWIENYVLSPIVDVNDHIPSGWTVMPKYCFIVH